jgi:hypothetical protein
MQLVYTVGLAFCFVCFAQDGQAGKHGISMPRELSVPSEPNLQVLLLLLGKVGPQRLLLRGVLENKTGGWE